MTPFNDTFLKACRKEEVSHTPVWFMRQAGRYQATYRETKKKYSIIDICKIPEVCAEVTFTPVNQFALDAAIVFSDIMIPLEPMGINFEYVSGVGPVIHNPIATKADIDRLKIIDPALDLKYTGDALGILKKGLNIPCLGFVGAPFTLASYMIEGGPSKSYAKLKALMYNQPENWHLLMDKLTIAMTDYLLFQAESGAAALQIFDSWVGILSVQDYREYVAPHTEKMIQMLKEKTDAPIILFGTNTAHLLQDFKKSNPDVLGIDWKTDINTAWKDLDYQVAVQGNLDPTLLFAEWPLIEKRTKAILDSVDGRNGHIFNLGHGILPGTPEENVKQLADFVRAYTS